MRTNASANPSNQTNNVREDKEECAEINSLAIDGVVETTGVLSFENEACEAADVLGKHYMPSRGLLLQGELQDLKEYFRRPRLIGNGTLGVDRGYVKTGWVTPQSLLTTYFPSGRTRLEGVGGMRFVIVFTLQVSATPFHQGLLTLSWNYGPRVAESNFTRHQHPATQLHLPHVRLDLSTTTMVQLRVPWLALLEWMSVEDTSENTDNWYGDFALRRTLSLPTVAGLSPATYNLFMHLEDLELTAPTVPLSRRSTIVPQAGKVGATAGKGAMAEEFENDAYPWSSTLHAASRTARFLAAGVPSLASIAGPAAWFLGKSAGVLRYLGFSKPQIQEPVARITTSSCVGQQNVDLPSQTLVAGPFASNSLRIEPTFAGTDVDEMSLAYVLSQWSAICVGNLSTSLTASSCLYAASASPSALWYREPSSAPYGNIQAPWTVRNDAAAFIPSNLFFWSSMFRQWRGSFEFRFTFAKTKFHAGRLLAAFIPGRQDRSAPSSDTLPSVQGLEVDAVGLQPFTYGKVFDLRDDNVFTFDVPFVCDVPYLSFWSTFGTMTLSVLDPLVGPATVSPNVSFMVEVRGKPDFELAVPQGGLYPTLNFDPVGADTYTIRAQAGELKATVPADVCETTVGERVMSAKQLIMMPRWMYFSLTANSIFDLAVPRWFYQAKQVITDGSLASVTKSQFGFGGYISKCYLFARGGTDVHTASGRTEGFWSMFSLYPTYFGADRDGVKVDNAPRTTVPRVYGKSADLNVRIPGYALTPRVYTFAYDDVYWESAFAPTPNWSGRSPYYRPPYLGLLKFRSESAVSGRVYFMRSASDDAMLGHYVGPPPLGLVTIAPTGDYDPDSFIF